MTKHWNPLQDLMLLQERMNRLFEDATERQARTGESDDIDSADWHPAADVYDTEDAYLIAVDLPGVVRSEVEIDLDDEKLIIRGSRNLSHEADEKLISRCDRRTLPPEFQSSWKCGSEESRPSTKTACLGRLPKRNEPKGQGQIQGEVTWQKTRRAFGGSTQ